jgi:dienelactone hydrolase
MHPARSPLVAILSTLLLGALGSAADRDAPPPFYPDKRDLAVYLDAQGRTHPVRSRRDWAIRRAHILGNMEQVMGPLPAASAEPPAFDVLRSEELPRFRRLEIVFVSEALRPDGVPDRVPAFLLIPRGPSRRRPAVLCLHQTIRIGKAEPAGLGPNPDLDYAAELAERGFVTLAPDYPNFGSYVFDPYAHGYASATMKGIVNHRRAVDLLRALPEVDPERIGVAGHSLGGHNALFLAAFDPRIKAVVSSCGFNSFAKYKGGDLTGWSHKGYMPRIAELYGRDPARMPFDFTEIVGAIAPRPIFVNAPLGDRNFEVSGVRDCLEAARPIYERVFGAPGRLTAVHPDTGHSFPIAAREAAYAFLERWLR